MAKCGVCDAEVPQRELFRHRMDKHPEEFEATRKAATAKSLESRARENGSAQQGEKPTKGQTSPSAGVKPTHSLDEASLIAIAPRRFEMTSTLLWQARAAAIREWHWPADISPEDFLDTFLHGSFKQRGILLGAYQVVEKDKG